MLASKEIFSIIINWKTQDIQYKIIICQKYWNPSNKAILIPYDR